jgi:taurine dioxygenase
LLHRWAPGDVVVWDNRSVLHAPSPFDSELHPRLLYRITVGGPQIAGF